MMPWQSRIFWDEESIGGALRKHWPGSKLFAILHNRETSVSVIIPRRGIAFEHFAGQSSIALLHRYILSFGSICREIIFWTHRAGASLVALAHNFAFSSPLMSPVVTEKQLAGPVDELV